MATTADARVDISLDAADRVVSLGLWAELKSMLEHTERAVPGLRSITVSLDKQSDSDEPIVLILANRDDERPETSGIADESVEWKWDRWAIETFASEVLQHFC